MIFKPFRIIRRFILNLYFFHSYKRISIGKRVKISGKIILGYDIFLDDNVEVRNKTPNASFIGNRVSINRNSVLRGCYHIGDNVAIGPNCVIIGANHNYDNKDMPIARQKSNVKGIFISENVWIGAGCIVLDGVSIGPGCVIGAGSVVTKSIEANSVAVGNPCRVIKKR